MVSEKMPSRVCFKLTAGGHFFHILPEEAGSGGDGGCSLDLSARLGDGEAMAEEVCRAREICLTG